MKLVFFNLGGMWGDGGDFNGPNIADGGAIPMDIDNGGDGGYFPGNGGGCPGGGCDGGQGGYFPGGSNGGQGGYFPGQGKLFYFIKVSVKQQ